jgi:hypothetical protein
MTRDHESDSILHVPESIEYWEIALAGDAKYSPDAEGHELINEQLAARTAGAWRIDRTNGVIARKFHKVTSSST